MSTFPDFSHTSVDGEWVGIPGYEGYYQVSRKGDIRSCDRVVPNRWGNGQHRKGKVMRLGSTPNGYAVVVLQKDGVVKHRSVHRIVASAFVPNPEGKPQINHIDGDKKNNAAENLEWCTQEENMQHAVDTGLFSVKGACNPRAKLSEEDVARIRMSGGTAKGVAERYHIAIGTAYDILARRSWVHVS